MTIVFAILLFSILIFVHELGHFLVAKLSGVQVNEFSMFMGPAIWKKKKGETLYSIRCIPIGGYCAMEGEDADSENPRSFRAAAWWKRLLILIAGSSMNLIAGFLIIVIVNSCLGITTTQIADIRPGSTISSEGGIQVGDTILEMNGTPLASVSDFDVIISADESATSYDVLVLRDGQRVLLEDVPFVRQEFQKDEHGEAGLFFGFTWGMRKLGAGEVITQSFADCIFFAKQIWLSLGMLLSGQAGLEDVSGPVGIVSLMSDMASSAGSVAGAVLNLLYFGGFIAINLGVMNMLPIPALDGGRVVSLLLTTGIEAATRKKIDPKYEGYIHAAGMVLLLLLIAVIMFKDIFVIITG